MTGAANPGRPIVGVVFNADPSSLSKAWRSSMN